jgi:Flp pilus assembly pilin Flp
MDARNIDLVPVFPCRAVRRFQGGVTSIEYALIASLLSVAIVVGVGAVGEANLANWSSVVAKVLAAINSVL